MVDADLLLIHGFWSSPATWDRLTAGLSTDPDLVGLRIHAFGYESPKLPRWSVSPTRIPDYNDIAQSLPAYLAAHAPGDAPLVVVTHSQGGLILQRFLAWMLAEGRGRELTRIRAIVMLACPNEGSEYLASIRAATGMDRNPQAAQLGVLTREVGDARRTVIRQIVNATTLDDRQCPIPVHVYAGRTDNIVTRQSAQSAFPTAEVLPGDHFTILSPDTPGNLTVPTLKRHILTTTPQTAGQDPIGPRCEGPRESAAEIGGLLSRLDRAALSGGEEGELGAVLDEIGRCEALTLHLRRRGLDPRVVLPSLPQHDEALARWLLGAEGIPGAAALPAAVRQLAVRVLLEERAGLSPGAAAVRAEVLSGPVTTPDAVLLRDALASRLPSLRPTTAEAVLVRSADSPALPAALPALQRTALSMTALPRREPLLAGRVRLVADIADRIRETLTRQGSATAFLSGRLGAGVSTVAVEVARALASGSTGGARYVDLRGLDEDSRRSDVDVARLVCHSFGETPIPGSELEQYREVLAGRGVVVVLDNALDALHVSRLVPAPSAGAMLVTSRNRTQGYADRGLVIQVPPLTRADSLSLLLSVRNGGVIPDLDNIAQACADLPLALRLISSWMMNHPESSVRSIARQLAAENSRLAYLDDGVRAMRAAIAVSYEHLHHEGRQVFRFLPAAPGSAATATDMARGLEREDVLMERVLYGLVDRSVAGCEEPETEDIPVFRLFELVRLYALERLEQEDLPEAVARFQHLLVTRLRDEVGASQSPAPDLVLDATRLAAARGLAERREWFDLAADLTDGLRLVHEAESDDDAIRRDLRRAAGLRERHGDAEGAVRTYLALARALGKEDEAEDVFAQAERVAERAGASKFLGEAAFERSRYHNKREEPEKALAAGERAFDALHTAGLGATAVPVGLNNVRIAMDLDIVVASSWLERTGLLIGPRTPAEYRSDMAWARARLSGDSSAVECWREASRLQDELGRPGNAGLAAYLGAQAALRARSAVEAAGLFLAAADLLRQGSDVNREICAVIGLSNVYAEIGQISQARDVLMALRGRVGVQDVWDPAVVAELALRIEVLEYLATGKPPEPDSVMVAGETPGASSRLAEIAAALRRPADRDEILRAFAQSPMIHQPPPHEHWIYENLGDELADQLALTRE